MSSGNGMAPESVLEAEKRRRQHLEQENEALRRRISELEESDSDKEARLSLLERRLDALAGIGDGEETTATKRRRDLVVILKRKAERNGGSYAMDYNNVKDDLAAHNHGQIADKQAFRDMRNIAERVRGVSIGTHPVSGNEAVLIDLDQFDGLPSEESDSSDVVSRTREGVARSDPQKTASTVGEDASRV